MKIHNVQLIQKLSNFPCLALLILIKSAENLDLPIMGRAKSRLHAFFKHRDNHVNQQSTNILCEGQRVNILGFADHKVTIGTTQLFLLSKSSHRQYVNYPIKLYLQKHGRLNWPLGQ